jgi:oligoendopeptidase F
MIFAYKDSSSEFWNGEYEYISTGYPELYQKIENVMVAAAQSADALYYEEKYFGKGLIADYADGGDYTDAVVSLLEEEASLVSRYSSLSTATIEITYQQEKGTYDSFMEKIKKLYHEDSADFKSKSAHLWSLYKSTYSSIAIPIFTDLVKVRIKLADLLGYESYLHYSYEGLGRDYTPEDMSELLEGIVEYAVPVMTSPDLQYYAMIGIGGNKPLSFDQLMNNSYYILDKMDAELFEIYQYMLQFSLFDLDKPGANRYSGAFTTYIGDYEAPFLFMTGDGYLTDYMTLFHEFGHFSDYYLNGASGSSLDLMEVYSQGLEFLMTTRCDEVISEEYGTYLSNRALYNALGILIDQGFYSRFEECVYSLEPLEITSERLEALLNQCAKEFGYITDTEFDGGSYMPLSTVMMVNHLFVSPGYVPSYCTSIISSLDLYYLEEETEGAGIETYKHLLALGGKGYDITEAVSQVGLSSPFEKAHLKELTNKIYYNFSGAYYWQPEDSTNNVA